MIHELFCVGQFERQPGDTGSVMLRRATRAISPVVKVPLYAKDLLSALTVIGDDDRKNVLSDGVELIGILLVDGYLECYSDRIDEESRSVLKLICQDHHCMVIDCLGRITSLDAYVT